MDAATTKPLARKIALLGFRAVGKSSISEKFVTRSFSSTYDPTVERTLKLAHTYKNRQYDLTLIDTAGQDEYSFMVERYTQNMDGYIIVYDISSRKSFEVTGVIWSKLLDMTGKNMLPAILVGNKSDLDTRVVATTEGQSLSDELGIRFYETSAKKSESLDEIINTLIQLICENEKGPEEPAEAGGSKCLLM